MIVSNTATVGRMSNFDEGGPTIHTLDLLERMLKRNFMICVQQPSILLSCSTANISSENVPFIKSYPKPAGYNTSLHKPVSTKGLGNKFRWLTNNKRVHPPIFDSEHHSKNFDVAYKESLMNANQESSQQVVLNPPPYVCHMRDMIKYSPKKMWYVAAFVRGMNVEKAITQLGFINGKGAYHVREILLEAQEIAVKEHNIEMKTKMWIAESFCTVAGRVKGGVKRQVGVSPIDYMFCNYFVRLEEGEGHDLKSGQFLLHPTKTAEQWLESYIREHRSKHIPRM